MLHTLVTRRDPFIMAISEAERKSSAESVIQPKSDAGSRIDLWEPTVASTSIGRQPAFDSQWQKYIGGNSHLELFEPKWLQAPAPKPIEFTNRLFDAYERAVAEKKPLIVEFSQESCKWCKRLNQETLDSPELRKYRDKGIWVRVDPMKDEDDKGNVAQLQKDLKIERFPAVVVLEVTPTTTRELGRIIGFFEAKDFANNLEQILPKQQKNIPNPPLLLEPPKNQGLEKSATAIV